jgi:fructosamine-3-kinase
VATDIARARGVPFRSPRVSPVRGGCIHAAVCLDDGARRFFVKANRATALPMFAAEAAGLAAIAATGAVRTPAVVTTGANANAAWLVLEWVDLGGPADERRFGAQLAALHRATSATFGFDTDNFIGATPQQNDRHADWAAFFATQRLGPQAAFAANDGHHSLASAAERLLERLPRLLAHAPAPALLHGDLWSGNRGFGTDGAPVLFDPAVYYGDREVDLAMTVLFGGFGPDFLAAYRDVAPLPEEYAMRRDLYNLYHLLNHAHLFGGGYIALAARGVDRLLAET